MDHPINDYKYQRHSEKQFSMILSAAERLFDEKGVDQVNLTDIAEEYGITRATLYRYFRNKEEVLWHIMRRKTHSLTQKLVDRFRSSGGTAYDRYKTFIDLLIEVFSNDAQSFLFISVFNPIYQNVTSSKEHLLYDKIFREEDFKSGDIVRFLMENFHDGTLKQSLDPRKTAVTITYSAMSIVTEMARQLTTLSAKYDVQPEDVVRTSLTSLLESIRV